eukprot:3811521-Prymnesium_polylepis.1
MYKERLKRCIVRIVKETMNRRAPAARTRVCGEATRGEGQHGWRGSRGGERQHGGSTGGGAARVERQHGWRGSMGGERQCGVLLASTDPADVRARRDAPLFLSHVRAAMTPCYRPRHHDAPLSRPAANRAPTTPLPLTH